MYIISELWIYPIKSLGGISVSESKVEIKGLQHDRRWMLVDGAGRFVTQRERPAMALLRTALEPSDLLVFPTGKQSEPLRIPLAPEEDTMERVMVDVWGDRCASKVFPDAINDWFSGILGQSLRLVMMPNTTRRRADGRYAPKGQYVSFADGFPFLLAGQSSLDDLNGRLLQPLPMNRFRPNIVFTGGGPFEEDGWEGFDIGDQPFRGVKPCARCVVTTIDQDTGERAAEPLKTLSAYRKIGNKIRFGQNVVWLGEGTAILRVGDVLRPYDGP